MENYGPFQKKTNMRHIAYNPLSILFQQISKKLKKADSDQKFK